MFNKKITRLIAIITLVLLPFCSPVIKADEPDLSSILENWYEITDISDFVAKFSKFVYYMKGEEGEITEFIYEHMGKETVDGVELEKVSMRGSSPDDEQEMFFWYDQDGKMTRALDNKSGQQIPMFLAGFVTSVFLLPFFMSGVIDFQELMEAEDQDVMVLTEVSERDVGGLPATIYTYTITGYDDDGQEVKSVYEIGDFGDFQIVVGVDMDIENEEYPFGFWVEEIVLH